MSQPRTTQYEHHLSCRPWGCHNPEHHNMNTPFLIYVSRFPPTVILLIFILLVSVPQAGRWGGPPYAVGHGRPGGVRCHHEGLLPRRSSLCAGFFYDRQGFIWGGPLLEDEGKNPLFTDSVTRRYWVRQIKKSLEFTVTPRINNIQHFNNQLT